MSDISQGPGWWYASDGRWYPPEQAPGSPTGTTYAPPWNPYAPTAATVSPGLALAVRITFWVLAGIAVVVALVGLWALFAFKGFEHDLTTSAHDTWRVAAGVLALVGLLYGLASLTLLVLIIVWTWQAHQAATDLGADLGWKRGWAIAAWLIPCASIVLPKIVTGRIERAAMARRREGRVTRLWSDSRTSTTVVGWVWWLAFVLSTFRFGFTVSSSGNAVQDATVNGAAYTTSYGFAVVAALLALVSALVGAVYIRRISDRLTPTGLVDHRDD